MKEIQIDKNLPISNFEEEISKAVREGDNLIIIGETGSGKTTQTPLILLKTIGKFQNLKSGKIVVTEPRRIATTSVAEYLSGKIEEKVGETIGYKIRFSEKSSDRTNLMFMTDGMLLREIQINPFLEGYSVVMIDEAHERNLNTDFLLGLLVDIQNKRIAREYIPLQLIVASATLEKEKFINFFKTYSTKKLTLIEIPGRLYPIHTFFRSEDTTSYEFEAAKLVQKICTGNIEDLGRDDIRIPQSGDILIFMPGKAEIEKTKFFIQNLDDFEQLNLEILTVHGELPIEEQNKIFKAKNKRKVVVATNVAETSLTVPGIRFVIDSGLIKVMEYNYKRQKNSLVTKLHSRKGLEQRKGRAGRIETGYYFGLFTEKSLEDRTEYPVPEIQRSLLSQVILIMKSLNINDVENFAFIDKPDPSLIRASISTLENLGAIDKKKKLITRKGIIMSTLPLNPSMSNLIIEADKNGCVESICTIVSFLDLKPVFLEVEKEILKSIIQEKVEREQLTNDSIFETESITADLLARYFNKKELKRINKVLSKKTRNYIKNQNRLKDFTSDFFTFLKVEKEWIKNEKSEEWAKDNFLSLETIQEAYNIKTDLLEIAKQHGLSCWDRPGSDLRERIEKTLINTFKLNILYRLRNGLFVNLSTKESVKVSQYSVLYKAKTNANFALASEIIEIREISEKPKLSAKYLHLIEDDVIKKYIGKSKVKSLTSKRKNKKKFYYKSKNTLTRYRKRF